MPDIFDTLDLPAVGTNSAEYEARSAALLPPPDFQRSGKRDYGTTDSPPLPDELPDLNRPAPVYRAGHPRTMTPEEFDAMGGHFPEGYQFSPPTSAPGPAGDVFDSIAPEKPRHSPQGGVIDYGAGKRPETTGDIFDQVTNDANPGVIDAVGNAIKRGLIQSDVAMELQNAEPLGTTIAAHQRELPEYPASDEYQAFGSAKSVGDAWEAFKAAPHKVTAELVGESLASMLKTGAQMAPARIAEGAGMGAAIGAPAGGVGAIPGAGIGATAGFVESQGATSYALESAGKILDTLSAGGVDLRDDKALKAAFSDPAKMKELRAIAKKKALPIALFDGASALIGGRLFGTPARSLLGKVAHGTAEMGTQMAMGMGGEVAGELNAGEKLQAGAILGEGLGEIGGGGVEIAAGMPGRVAGAAKSVANTVGGKVRSMFQQRPEPGTQTATVGDVFDQISPDTEISLGEEAQAPAVDPLAAPIGAPAAEESAGIPAEQPAPVQTPAPAPTPLDATQRAQLVRDYSFPAGLASFLDSNDYAALTATQPGTRQMEAALFPIMRKADEAFVAAQAVPEETTSAVVTPSPDDNVPFALSMPDGTAGLGVQSVAGAVRGMLGGELPANVVIYSRPGERHESGAVVNGFAYGGNIFLNAGTLRDAAHVQRVLLEEAWHLIEKDPALADARARLEATLTPEQLARMAELGYGANELTSEALARELQRVFTSDTQRSLWQRVLDTFTTAFRNLLGKEATVDDARAIIGATLRHIAPTALAQSEIRYSLEPPSQAEAEAAGSLPGERRRQFMENVAASRNVAPINARLESIYQPITNEATVAAAKARINELGIDRALAEVLATGPQNPPTALSNATGIELMARLQAVHRYEETAALAEHIAAQATTQGQAIQALSLLTRLTPEGVNVYAQRLIARAVSASTNPEVKALHETIQRLKKELAQAKWNHATKAIMDIIDAIRNGGLDPAKQTEVLQKLRDALILSTTQPGDALGRVTQVLVTAGMDRAKAVKLAKKALESFKAAQKAARERLLKKMAAAAVKQAAKDDAERWLKMNHADVLTNDKLTAEMGKKVGLPVFTLEHGQKLAALSRAYEAAPMGDLKLAAAARMMEAVHELVPVDFWTKVRAVRNMAMLLNPKTVIRNIGGNVVLWLAERPADALSWAIDAGTSLVTGAHTRTGLEIGTRLRGLAAPIRDYRAGYDYAKQQGQAHGLWRAGVEHMLTMARLTSGGVFHEGGFREGYRRVFTDRLGGMLENTLSLMLGAPDRAFHQSAYLASLERQMNAQPVRALAPTPEMITEALADANAAIFQDDNVVSRALGAVQRSLNLNKWGQNEHKFGLGNVILPFTGVPGSIIARAVGTWSPIGFVRGLYEGRHLVFNRGQFNQRAFTELLSRGALGTGLGYLGYYLFKLGVISALAEDDPDREAMRKAAGLGQFRLNVSELFRRVLSGNWHQPASMMQAAQQGDVVMNYDWMQPLAVPFAAGAQLAAQEAGNARTLARGGSVAELSSPLLALAAGARTIEAQPLVSSFTHFMGEAGRQGTPDQPAGGLASALLHAATDELVSGFVPTAVRQVAQLGDNTMRETRAKSISLDGTLAALPGMSAKFPPRYDLLGEMQQRYQYGTNTAFNVLLNPAFTTHATADPLLRELDGLYERTGNGGVLLRQAGRSVTVNGKRLDLTNEQRSAYQHFIGQVSATVLREMIAAPNFARLPDDPKAKLTAQAISGVVSAGKILQLGDRPKEPDFWTVNAIRQALALGYRMP